MKNVPVFFSKDECASRIQTSVNQFHFSWHGVDLAAVHFLGSGLLLQFCNCPAFHAPMAVFAAVTELSQSDREAGCGLVACLASDISFRKGIIFFGKCQETEPVPDGPKRKPTPMKRPAASAASSKKKAKLETPESGPLDVEEGSEAASEPSAKPISKKPAAMKSVPKKAGLKRPAAAVVPAEAATPEGQDDGSLDPTPKPPCKPKAKAKGKAGASKAKTKGKPKAKSSAGALPEGLL